MANAIRSGSGSGPQKKPPAPKTVPIHDMPPPNAGGPGGGPKSFYVPPDPATASVSPAKAIRTLELQGNKTLDARLHMEVGLPAEPAEENTTSLLLNAVGYTGNSVNDFNAAVDNINKTFIDVYGYAPTPGLVLDMLRTPVAHSKQALESALTGAPLPSIKPPPTEGLPPEAQYQNAGPFNPNAPSGDKQGFRVAVQLAVAERMPKALFQTSVAIEDRKALQKQVDKIDSGDPTAMQDSLFTAPFTSGAIGAALSVNKYMQDHGIQPYELKNDMAGNQLLLGGAATPSEHAQAVTRPGSFTVLDSIKSVADVQDKIKANFKGVTLPANGVWSSDWQKLSLYMQANKRWQQISRIQQAINYLGYTDESLDPFKSVDQQGNITSQDAVNLIKRAQGAYKARQGALTGHWWSPLVSHVLGNLPPGVFAQGGLTNIWKTNVNLGATARWIAGGDFSNPAGALESGVRNSTVLMFDGMGGTWTQGKADLWAASALADPQLMLPGHKGNLKQEVTSRLVEGEPTWGRILGSLGSDLTYSTAPEHEANKLSEEHPNAALGFDVIGDMVVGSLISGPEMSTTDLATYAKMYERMGRAEFAKALLKREPFFAERTGQAFNLLKRGGSRNRVLAVSKLDGHQAAERFLRQERFQLHDNGGITEHPYPTEMQSAPNERAAAVGKENGAVPDQAVPPEKLHSLAALVRAGHVDKELFHELTAEAFAKRGEMFNSMKAVNVPAYTNMLLHRMQLWNKGRLPIYTVHPIRWVKGAVGRTLYDALDQADSFLFNSSIAGETKAASFFKTLRYIENQARVQGTKAANPRVQPLATMESANIRRLALKAGFSVDKAYALEGMFQVGRGRGDMAIIQRVRDMLGQKFMEQGRVADKGAVEHTFSVLLDRSNETDKFKAALKENPSDVFQLASEKSLAKTQWSSLSAERYNLTPEENAQRTAKLEQDLRSAGFDPVQQVGVYGGDKEQSFFVPGMTAKEAMDLGKKYDQESILSPQGMVFMSGDNAGKIIRTKGYLFGNQVDHAGDRTELTIGDKTYYWSWVGKTAADAKKAGFLRGLVSRGKQDANSLFEDVKDEYLNANPIEGVKPMNAEQARNRLLEVVHDPETRDVIKEHVQELGKETGKKNVEIATTVPEGAAPTPESVARAGNLPNLTTQMMDTFAVPEAMMPRTLTTTGTYVQALNNAANRLGLINRELILATDPILFEKHGITDGIRHVYAQWDSSIMAGGPIKDVVKNRMYVRGLSKYLADNPEAQRQFDQLSHFHEMGEYRYDLSGITRGGRIEAFNTGHYLKDPKHMRAAADYVDRLISDGSYRAYQQAGPRGVYDFYHTDRAAIRLAGETGMKADELAQQTLAQIADIEVTAPGFLKRALDLKRTRGAKLHFRKALTHMIQKEQISIPVVGSVEGKPTMGLLAPLDSVSGKLIGAYMTPNKFYRGTLFQNITARAYHDLTAAGMAPEHAFQAALASASKTTRYHMLDLADAMQWEQTLRWAAMFFTKHRLYWTWLYQTIKHRPYLAAAVQDVENGINSYNKQNPNSQPGSIDIQLPVSKIPLIGQQVADVAGTTYRLPVARLLWLASSQANPGAYANLIHAATSGSSLLPGRGSVQFTTMDSAINAMGMYLHMRLNGKGTSDSAIAHMDPLDAARFRSIYDQMQASYMAHHHGRPMPDHEATQSALLHFAVVNSWQSTAFTGMYPTDPKLSTEQQKQWNHYNSLLDPKARETYRAAHPWIDTQIGMSSTSPKQWVLTQQMWGKFNHVMQQHNARKEKLLAEYKATGDPGFLFGAAWHAEGKDYQHQINRLQATAAHMGATEWLTQFKNDPLTGLHAAYASMLHQLYPSASQQEIKGAINKLDPPEIRHAKTLLGGLTNSFIATFPVEQRASFEEARAYLSRVVSAFESVPADKVSKLRDDYFTKVYDQFATKYEGYLVKANSAPAWRKPLVYEQLREYMDSIDKPVMMNGIEMPSPVRAKYALLPTQAKVAYRQSQMIKQWGFLTAFQKHLLGVKVDGKVQAGWSAFYDDIAAALKQVRQTDPTRSISVDATKQLEIAQAIDTKYPGFYTDYVRSLMPLYTRLQGLKLGRTAGSQKAWNDYLGTYIEPLANALGGPVTAAGPALVERAKKFNSTTWTNLMEWGPTVGGTGWADVPDSQNPEGGALYQRAMQYPDPVFRNEFKAMVANNPNFISLLFKAGG